MKKIAPLIAIILLASISAGTATAQNEEVSDETGEVDLVEDGEEVSDETEKADLAVEHGITDLEGNPIDKYGTSKELLETISVTNLGPDNATGVIVDPWEEGVLSSILSWNVSWDGGLTWIENDPSVYWPEYGGVIWDIKNLPVNEVYILRLISTIDEIGGVSEGYFGVTIYSDQYDPDKSNNEAKWILYTQKEWDWPTYDQTGDNVPVKYYNMADLESDSMDEYENETGIVETCTPPCKIPMQSTGVPIALAILSVLMTLGSLVIPRK